LRTTRLASATAHLFACINWLVSCRSMSTNPLTGPFPPILFQLTNLTSLKLDHTSISGAIPPGIGNLTKLQFLYLGNNSNLQGPLPSSELGLLTELLELTIWGANLNTTLPHELGNCSKLQYINFHSSVMSGSLPEEYGSLQNLKKLLLHNNNLEGVIPQTWRNLMPHITDLYAPIHILCSKLLVDHVT
jgi:Leucine-rich repeat (LRR) protein